MMTELRNCKIGSVSSMAKNLREKGILLNTRQTVEKLCDIIDKNAFESGAHIDYYDR